MYLIDAQSGQRTAESPASDNERSGLGVSPDAKQISDTDGVWSLETRSRAAQFQWRGLYDPHVKWSPNGKMITRYGRLHYSNRLAVVFANSNTGQTISWAGYASPSLEATGAWLDNEPVRRAAMTDIHSQGRIHIYALDGSYTSGIQILAEGFIAAVSPDGHWRGNAGAERAPCLRGGDGRGEAAALHARRVRRPLRLEE